MKYFVLVKLRDGGERLINEMQVCSVSPGDHFVVLRLSDGEVLEVADPPWENWLNDYLNRSD